MKAPEKIATRLLLPLLAFNLAGLAAGAVWLGAAAQWQVIWIGIVAVLFSPYIIPFCLIPSGIFSHFMGLYGSGGRKEKERLMFVLSVGHVLLFITLWCAGIFFYVTRSVGHGAAGAALLWANAAALAPLLLWASRDRHNVFIATTVETAQLGMLILSLLWQQELVAAFWPGFLVLGAIMTFAAAVQSLYYRENKH